MHPKLPVWEYRSRGIVSVSLSFSVMGSCLLEFPEECCLLYVTRVEVQKRQDFSPHLNHILLFAYAFLQIDATQVRIASESLQ